MPGRAKVPRRLSVLLVTYNHEKYIRQALDALFGQVVEGAIELIVADDASSDQTLRIIKEYEEKQDRFNFRYLDNSRNLGITKNYQRGFAACSGEYVAVLEGDDYWISPLKLQRQMDFLDAHWESDCCAVNYFVLEEDRSSFYPRTAGGNGHRLIGARDMITDNIASNFSTCMYRKSALDALPEKLFDLCSYDWIVNICVARKSMIGFLEEPMSVYRLHSHGVWSQTPYVEKLESQLMSIPAYDALTEHIYRLEFELLSNRLKRMIAKANCSHVAATILRPFIALSFHCSECLPPALLWMLRVLTPPKLKLFIARNLRRGAA